MSSCQKNVKYQPDILIVQLQYQMKRLMNLHQTFFLPHFFEKPTNFSYLIFLGNPPNFPTSFFLGNPSIFPTSVFWETHSIFPTSVFWETHSIFPTSVFWETHQFFLPQFFGKPINFSYLSFWGNPSIFPTSVFLGNPSIFPTSVFLENPSIFPTSVFWETHQFFLPHFLGKTTNLVNETLKETPPHEVFGYYLCYHLEFLQAFHNEARYHWYLQDNASLVILSDKSAEQFKFENLKWCKPVSQVRSVFSQNLQKSHRKWDLGVSLRVSLTQISRKLTESET